MEQCWCYCSLRGDGLCECNHSPNGSPVRYCSDVLWYQNLLVLSCQICWEENISNPALCPPSYCRPFMKEYVAELHPKGTSGLNSVWDIARNQEYNRCSYWGPVALLKPTVPGRAGYYCGGSTFVTSPHESDGFHVSYAGETCVDIKGNAMNLSFRSLCLENSPSLPVQSPGRLPGMCEGIAE
jgi:hypothetical protein